MPTNESLARHHRSLRCLLGFHDWMVRYNDAGERYDECRRCGKASDYAPVGLGWSYRD